MKPPKPFRQLRIALVADDFTRRCLEHECKVFNLTPWTWKLCLRTWRPDLVLVESAWHGILHSWTFKIAAYPNRPRATGRYIEELTKEAKDRSVPTVFWNKEDGVHFERFIDSAMNFEHIFTVDESAIPRYRERVRPEVTVHRLMFAVQPALHSFSGFNFRHMRANFVGSYSRDIHDRRRAWQEMAFSTAMNTGLGLTAFDRNSNRKSASYRLPELNGIEVQPAVHHRDTANIYKDYLVSLNVNTVVDSPSMFSRRVVEVLACGGILVSNPSLAMAAHFRPYCHLVDSKDEASELFSRLKHGPSPDDLERARAGAACVLQDHVWSHRLAEIMRVIS